MRNLISPDRIANKIMKQRTDGTHLGSFLLVEGRSDKLVYQRLVDAKQCEIVVVSALTDTDNSDNNSGNYGGAKNLVLRVLEILETNNTPGILAVVDSDFWQLENAVPNSQNLLITDTHDLETMIMKSPALEKVIAEFASEEKIVNFNRDIKETLLAAGMPVGYLRWISLQDDLSLSFQNLSFNKFLSSDKLNIDESKLVKEVKNKSQKPALDENVIRSKLRNFQNRNDDAWLVCCGHDLVEILSLGLRKTWGSNDSKEVKPELLEKCLRLAYETSYFYQTELSKSLQRWEENNPPYRVLNLEVISDSF